MKIKAVLSVLGNDRKGVVATVSATLYECGVNIDDISQTILEGIFSMTMLVSIDEELCSFNDLQERLLDDGRHLGMQIALQRSDVFDFMYNV
ncbi:MAG: ACT domain-containing protein [Coriobacteriia bacterium]|nr:ACT domain-containing protein [Coriobacteriia bacterium]